jgi:membrane associated rhomboid family serine protease
VTRRPPSRPLDRLAFVDRFTFGGRVPGGIGIVLLSTVVVSLAVAFGGRRAEEIWALVPLVPARVLRGEIWRLLTWTFVETNPISLFFRCLMLYFFGRDLCAVWGSRRFFAVYFGIVIGAGLVTCALSLVDPEIREQAYLGSWPLDAALTIAWGLSFPQRVIRIYFVIPIRGYVLAWGSVALAVAFAVYEGWARHVPLLAAQGGMLAWMYRAPLRKRWLTHRLSSVQRELAAERQRRPRTVYEEPMSEEEEEELKRRLGRSRPPAPSDLN